MYGDAGDPGFPDQGPGQAPSGAGLSKGQPPPHPGQKPGAVYRKPRQGLGLAACRDARHGPRRIPHRNIIWETSLFHKLKIAELHYDLSQTRRKQSASQNRSPASAFVVSVHHKE